MSLNVALADPYWVGHHPAYFRLFAEAVLAAGHRLVALCPQPEAVDEWAHQQHSGASWPVVAGRFEDKQGPWLRMGRLAGTASVLARWRQVHDLLQDVGGGRPDLVVFPWLDAFLDPFVPSAMLDRIFPHAWTGLYFHPRHLRVRERAGLPRIFRRRPDNVLRSRKCRGVYVLDQGVAQTLSADLGGKPVHVLPDVAETTSPDLHYEPAKVARSRSGGRIVVGLLGSLERRKGVMTLIRLAQRLPADRYFFILAGTLAEATFSGDELRELQQFIREKRENCLFCLGWIPGEAQFNALVAACDVIFAAYVDFPHSSNLVGKAALFRKRLLVSRGYFMAEVVSRYHLGWVVDEGSVEQCAAALAAYADPFADPDYDDYERDHSPARFQTVFLNGLIGQQTPGTAAVL